SLFAAPPCPGSLLCRSTTHTQNTKVLTNFHPRRPCHNNNHMKSTWPAASAVRTKTSHNAMNPELIRLSQCRPPLSRFVSFVFVVPRIFETPSLTAMGGGMFVLLTARFRSPRCSRQNLKHICLPRSIGAPACFCVSFVSFCYAFQLFLYMFFIRLFFWFSVSGVAISLSLSLSIVAIAVY
ncbi:unnamed protein product, partial [Ectocarpus sp. 12 AP-2014]